MKRYVFELLTQEHDVSGFNCGAEALNMYVRDEAKGDMLLSLNRTYVLIDREEEDSSKAIIGYFALRAESIYVNDLQNRGYQDATLVPVVELSFLARDKRVMGQGFGDVLLVQAMRCVQEAAKHIGIGGIHLTATMQGRPLYEKYGFINLVNLSESTRMMFLPISDLNITEAEDDE
jgi:predicted GNAT family N-acyltransferase